MNPLPLIAICGTTGVGKSNLAVDLAVHLSRSLLSWKGARVINADAMQAYRGMDVITNKIPQSEMQGIEHLLIGFKEPGEQYVVGQWIQDALKAIEETHSRREIPIVVGGTSYWIQHLLFPGNLVSEGNSSLVDLSAPGTSPGENTTPQSETLAHAISGLGADLHTLFINLPSQPPSASEDPTAAWSLYTALVELDPVIAGRWHWHDTRKVHRSLQIIRETGRRASEIMAGQLKDASQGIPRYRTLIFWLYCESSILTERLNSRVDRMLEQGLLDEIQVLLKMSATSVHSSERLASSNYTLGIYQSIGYREFAEHLTSEKPTEAAFRNAVERMKISTRQYAKRQVSWIRNKLLPAVKRANNHIPDCVPTYLLNPTGQGSWERDAKQPAIKVMEDFLAGRALPDPLVMSSLAHKMLGVNDSQTKFTQRKIICPTCTREPDRPFMVNEGLEWRTHERTRAHRKLAAKRGQGVSISSENLEQH